MKLFSPRIWAIALTAIGLTLTAQPAKADYIQYFTNVTTNSLVDSETGANYKLTVSDAGNGQVSFLFQNIGATASSITDIYFDDGTLLGIAQIINGAGVDFGLGASPGNLPGGNNLDPDFNTTVDFSADSNPPAASNGVNPGEEVTIIFDLLAGKTYADTIAAIQGGEDGIGDDLRIGIHVQAFADGESEGFVNEDGGGGGGNAVPAPAGLILLASAVPVLAFRRLIRRKPVAA